MYAQLGSVIFKGMLSPGSMSISEAPNFAEIALVENKPRLQRLGSHLKTISLSIKFHSGFCDPDAQKSNLASAMEIGEALPLLMGDGRYLGDFVITRLDTDILSSAPTGETVECDVQVELTEYVVPDPGLSSRMAAAAKGFGMLENKPVKLNVAIPAQAPSLQVMQEVTAAKAEAGKATSLVDLAVRNATRAANAVKNARRSIAKAQKSMAKAEQLVQQAQQLQTQAQGALSSLAQARRNMTTMAAFLEPPVSLADAQAAARRVNFSMSNVSSSMAPIARLSATKRG